MLHINKVIIWGLRDSGHTHSFIHAGFFKAFKHLGYETHWLNSVDEAAEHKVDIHNAFYIFVDLVGQPNGPFPLPPLHSSCFYFGHHVREEQRQSILNVVPIENIMWFGLSTLVNVEQYNISSLYDYDVATDLLFLNWATDLLPHEIQRNIELLDAMPPTEPTIFHVGSMSNGWAAPYVEFMSHMREYGVGFCNFGPGSQFGLVSDEQNQTLIKRSFAAPALQFKWQVDVEYIPCRIFKNISYGKMGITNNPGVHRLFGEKTLYSSDLKELAKMTYEFENNPDKNKIIRELMEEVKEKHTYVSRIEFILNEAKKNKNVKIQKKLEFK